MLKEQQSPGNAWHFSKNKVYLNELNSLIDLKYPEFFCNTSLGKNLKNWITEHFSQKNEYLCQTRDNLGRAMRLKSIEESYLIRCKFGKLKQRLFKDCLLLHVARQSEVKNDLNDFAMQLPIKLNILENLKKSNKNNDTSPKTKQLLRLQNYKENDFDPINFDSLQKSLPIDEYYPKCNYLFY